LFTVFDHQLQVMLRKRRNEPFKDQWALPGCSIGLDEELENAALRILSRDTGLEHIELYRLDTYGQVGRYPRQRVISVVYLAVAPGAHVVPQGVPHIGQVMCFPASALPDTAFDHAAIISDAWEKLKTMVKTTPIAFQFLPDQFTLTELQTVFEVIQDEHLDKRNFRKWINSLDYVEETNQMRRSGKHRPAKLYMAKRSKNYKNSSTSYSTLSL
jgi:8-oxo-dGTP diphosphatase